MTLNCFELLLPGGVARPKPMLLAAVRCSFCHPRHLAAQAHLVSDKTWAQLAGMDTTTPTAGAAKIGFMSEPQPQLHPVTHQCADRRRRRHRHSAPKRHTQRGLEDARAACVRADGSQDGKSDKTGH